jgi:hypothetical protein
MGRTTPNLKAITYLTALPWKNTARGNWHILSGGPYSWALCGVQTVTADEYEITHDGRARYSKLDDVTCRKCRAELRHLPTRRYPAAVVEEMARTENARRDREARAAQTPEPGSWAARQRAPKAEKITPEELAERIARTDAERAERLAAEKARIIALLAEQPAPAHATWVYDSATGERVGWLSEAGVVPLKTPAPVEPVVEPVDQAVEQVVIVPCGAEKLDHAAPAGELYTSAYHRDNRAAAAAIAERTGARVLILSALHGLLTLDQVVEPYNLRMGQQGSVTTDQLRQQAAALGIRAARVTVLAGKAYANAVTAVWPDAARPYDGSRGLGDHRARARAIVRGELADQQAPAERPGDTRPALRSPLAGERSDLLPGDPRPSTRPRRRRGAGRRPARGVAGGRHVVVGARP